jgi:hypothetical protein
MSYSTLIKFLNDPCLRVTPSNCQNDPFEFGFSSSDIEALNCKSESKELGIKLEEFAKLHGIISLTTSNDDILMWSHYAENHRGAVVEIYIDDEKPQSLFINSTGPNSPPFNYQDFLFDKVSYKSVRRFEQIESEANIDKIKHHYYFTKARQWKLEDEYRFITPMIWINRILFNEAGCKKAQKILGGYSSSITCLNPRDTGCKFYELNPVALEMISIELISKLWLQSSVNETMFFIRLNSGVLGVSNGHIGRIFLGCQADHDDFISQLKNDSYDLLSIRGKYSNLLTGELCNVFKGEMDKDEYKLLFKPIIGNI